MSSNCRFLVATCAVPLSLAACGGGTDSEPTIVPEGAHHGYVVNTVSVPTKSTEATQFGLDLGTKTSSKPDGVVDNALGSLLGTLASPAVGLDIQGPLTDAVMQGSLILLVDLQAKDLTSAEAVGFGVKFGTNPVPAACSGPTDTTCGHHLDGSAMFSIDPASPTDAVVAGKIVSGAFNGTQGDIALQIVLGGTEPIDLDLLHARVQATGISETGIMSAKVGGLVTVDQLTTQLGPAILTQVNAIVDRDCPKPRAVPNCSCPAGSTGALVLSLADGMAMGSVKDCELTVAEVLGNPVVKGSLTPDSCSKGSCATADSLSIGVKVTAVKASF